MTVRWLVKSVAMTLSAALLLFLPLAGCAAGMVGALVRAAQVTQLIGSLIDCADDGQRAYFDRHPNMDSERRVKEAIAVARAAAAAANKVISAAEHADDGRLRQAQQEALQGYDPLWRLLEELGILAGRPPNGGAETDAPKPKPLALPPASEIAQLIGPT